MDGAENDIAQIRKTITETLESSPNADIYRRIFSDGDGAKKNSDLIKETISSLEKIITGLKTKLWGYNI